MQIIEKKLTELKEYEKNPRRNDQAVDAVAASIREFGFKVPIIIDKDNVIVAGHTRLKAARKLGLETVPCIIADDLSSEQIQAFRLADNKTAELAEWDPDLLLQELGQITIDMAQFGFDDSDIPEIDGEVYEDDYEEPEKMEPRTKLGDRYRLGDHILMCGDSTKEEDVLNLIGGGSDRFMRDRSTIQRGARDGERTRAETIGGETAAPQNGRTGDRKRRLGERRRVPGLFKIRVRKRNEGPEARRSFLYMVCEYKEF